MILLGRTRRRNELSRLFVKILQEGFTVDELKRIRARMVEVQERELFEPAKVLTDT